MAGTIVFYFVIFLSVISEIKFTSAQFYNIPPSSPNLYHHSKQQQHFYNPLQRASLHFQPQPYSSNNSPFSSDQHATTIQNQRPPEIFQGFLRTKDSTTINRKNSDTTQGRLLSASAFSKISETLGALNTVGHFIVNMTRGQDSDEIDSEFVVEDSVPDAILTITKNVLGQNMTKTIEPLIKRVGKDEDKFKLNGFDQKRNKTRNKIKKDTHSHVSSMTTASTIAISSNSDSYAGKENENRCKTPNGRPGLCEDLSNCPALLLDLSNLRESLCFKSLFVPGVCCPISQSTILTTERPIRLTTKPSPPLQPVFDVTTVRSTPQQNLILIPQYTTVTSTTKPISSALNLAPSSSVLSPLNVVSLDDCGQQEYSSGRIVGGIESPNGEWPWLAAIFLHGPKRTEFWCGGSLIGSKYILTAAHCTRDSRQKPFAARQFTVRLGDVDLSTDAEPSAPQTFQVKEVRAHERFSRVGFYNDVAILVLDKPARKSKYVIPVCLPKPKSHSTYRDKLSGKRATVVGWGTTYYGGKESTMLRQADLPVWRNDDCDRAYFQPITSNFLCAGYSEGGVDACQGDSGGPLMMKFDSRWVQIGIVSFGNKCGEPGYPGVYTRISEYIDWIKEHTRD